MLNHKNMGIYQRFLRDFKSQVFKSFGGEKFEEASFEEKKFREEKSKIFVKDKMKVWGLAFLGLGLLSFSGCVGSTLPPLNHYELKAQDFKPCLKNPSTFLYEGILIQNKIANKQIAYKESDYAIEYFAKNLWIESLAAMLETFVVSSSQRHCVELTQTMMNIRNTFSLKVYDLYYDVPSNEAVFKALGRIQTPNTQKEIWANQRVKVQEGEFVAIINAMNEAVNAGFDEIFKNLADFAKKK